MQTIQLNRPNMLRIFNHTDILNGVVASKVKHMQEVGYIDEVDTSITSVIRQLGISSLQEDDYEDAPDDEFDDLIDDEFHESKNDDKVVAMEPEVNELAKVGPEPIAEPDDGQHI